jgi:hypothetical protein
MNGLRYLPYAVDLGPASRLIGSKLLGDWDGAIDPRQRPLANRLTRQTTYP